MSILEDGISPAISKKPLGLSGVELCVFLVLDLGVEGVGCSDVASPSPLNVMGLFCHRMGKKMHLKNGEWKTRGVKTVAIKVIYSHGNRKLNAWK